MGRTWLIPLALALGACASAPEPDPALPTGIVVTPREEGRLLGGEAVYVIAAPRDAVVGLILDFDRQGEFRPTIAEARSVAAFPEGGTVLFRFRGPAGIEPAAECAYTIAEAKGVWALDFKMLGPSFPLWALEGSFRLKAVRGGAATLVVQRFLVSAMAMNREKLLADLRNDAEAIRARAEGARGEVR